jgi:gliding motility-associated-like protein
MKIKLLLIILLSFSLNIWSQQTCDSTGNLVIYSNYDGGILTINVDQNTPNLKVGICTYEPVQVNFTGPFVGNITQVIYAGFNSTQNNNNCGQGNFPTSISGVTASLISIITNPPVGYTPAHGNGAGPWGGTIIGAAGVCDTTTNAGGVNTPDEIVYYFQQATGGTLLFHKTQYSCWQNETINISSWGNCCILPPSINNGCNLSGNVSVIANSVCEPCFYNGPPILINELMISPSVNDGSICGPGPAGGRGEWIELYNPDLCDSVDISCYYLGNNTAEGTGGFRLPQGVIIPPNGYCMVRGINVDPVPSNLLVQNGGNVVEIVVPAEIFETGVCCSGTRVWFPNAGGWFAFYDALGNPIDAVRWGPGNVASLAGSPCISTQSGCSNATSLLSYNAIPDSLKFYASVLDGNSHLGQTIRRMPDGGTWSGIGQPTYAICNDPQNCLTGTLIGYCNGQGTVNVTSGAAPFSYQWDDDLNQTTQTATNLCQGTYNVVVTDANNCQVTYTINVITNPFNLTTIVQQPACQQNNGAITITPFDSSYIYTWTPAVSTSNSAINLAQGIYTITIEQGFCSLDTTILLQNPVPFSTSVVSTQTSCGLDNGTISIANFPTGNYAYNWTPNVSSSNNAVSLAAGNYQISITDNVCIYDTIINIQPSSGLTSTATIYNSTCQQANGAIDIDVLPLGSYTFSWPSNVSSTIDSASNLAAGDYIISFTDGTCIGDTVITVLTTFPPTDVIANVTATQCDENTGEIGIATTTGGTSPYTFAINNGNFSNISIFDSLAQGSNTISVLDANNCLYQEVIFVPVFAGPTFVQVNSLNPSCGSNNGSLIINGVLGGTQPYFVSIDGNPVSIQDSLINLGVGNYLFEVTDGNGCNYSQIETLIMTSGESSIRIPNVLTANNDETNDIWKIETECVESIECTILNRWGNEIYRFSDLNGGWDGKTNSGSNTSDGVYFYKLIAYYFGGGSEIFHGHITLIR